MAKNDDMLAGIVAVEVAVKSVNPPFSHFLGAFFTFELFSCPVFFPPLGTPHLVKNSDEQINLMVNFASTVD